MAASDEQLSALPTSTALPSGILRGALVSVDGLGVEHQLEDGQLELNVWKPSRAADAALEPELRASAYRQRLRDRRVVTIEVRAGRWEASLPARSEWSIVRARLGGRQLADLQSVEIESEDPSATELRVTGHSLYPAHLRVVDRESQRELDGVEVTFVGSDDSRRHPGDLRPAGAPQPSPIEILPVHPGRAAYLVGAEGHAWQRIECDHLSDDERVVELEPCGDLVVEISTEGRRAERMVTLTSPGDEHPYTTISALSELRLTIRGVAPGNYLVELAPAAALVRAQVPSLAQESANVIAGGVTSVALREPSRERPLAIGLAGQLRMSSAWSPGGPHLLIRALGPTAFWHLDSGGVLPELSVAQSGGSWTFRSPAAVAGGRYLLHELRTGFLRELEVDPAGSTELRFEIPDPIELQAEVIDGTSGAGIAESELSWMAPAPPGVADVAFSSLGVERSDRAGGFRLRVPAYERVGIEARAKGFETARVEWRAQLGATEPFRIQLARR